MKYDYLVVGAGLYGAIFAHEAKAHGKSVLVVDKRPNIAGNIYTENIEGINVHKYGAHIFHTNNKKVWNYITRFAEFNRFTNSPVANYKGELYSLPFNMYTFNKMWGVVTPEEAAAKIEEQRREITHEPQNLEEQAISLVGRDIYEKLIKGYTEKQWGRDCKDLPAFIIKRLPVRLTFDNNYFNALYQGIPNGGYTAMVEKMLDGTEVRLGVDYLADRDALNALAAGKYRGDLPANTILTPHPGEAARLLGLTVPEVQADREGAAVSLAEKYHCVAVLKGHHTLVAAPGGTVWLFYKDLVHELCFLQSGDDEGDEHQLCDDARHSGEERTGQEGREREARAGQARQHEADRAPDEAASHHGRREGGVGHGQGVLHPAVEPAGHSAVSCQLKSHRNGDGEHRGHPEEHRTEQRGRKAHSQTPRSAQHEAAEQDGEMHRAEHIAYLRQMARHHGQHEGQRQKECGQHDIAGRRRVFGFHLFPPVTAPQKNKKRGLPVGLQANGRPLHGVCFKNAAAENSVRRASARRPGFLPEIVKIIAECRRICQDRPGRAAN